MTRNCRAILAHRLGTSLANSIAVVLLAAGSGCGNQMMRQPGFRPVDTPRAAPPVDAVSVSPALLPSDGRVSIPPAFGAADRATAYEMEQMEPTITEPPLPPADLSDTASKHAAPKSVDSIGDPLPDRSWVLAAGRDIFNTRCVQCHGATGTGDGPVGKYLIPPPPNLSGRAVQRRTAGAMFWQISVGTGKMPGFRNWTTPAQRWEVVRFVHGLNGPTAGAWRIDTRIAPYPEYGSPQLTRLLTGPLAARRPIVSPYKYDSMGRQETEPSADGGGNGP